MTRMTPERRAEIERGDTTTPQFVRGHQLTDREADVRDLLAELHAVEAENTALREGLEDLRCTGHKNGWVDYDVQCVAGPAPNRCIQVRRLLRAGGGAE